MSTPTAAHGPGLFEITRAGADRAVTNIRKLAGRQPRPGEGLINTATVLLGLLDGALFAVSLAAQYQYIFRAKHQSWPAIIEALALDAGMIIFSLLALGLARAGKSARIERALIVVCALGSAAMNYAAADVTSARSVAAYVMPPVFLAIVTDRVVAVVRRHVLGDEERSAWATVGRAAVAVLAVTGRVALYGLRLVLAPGSTLGGLRRCVLLATPLPAPALPAPDRAALPPGLCAVEVRPGSGELCGRARLCSQHEPEVRHPSETKKAHLLRLYADHPEHGDRSAVGRVAAQLAEYAQLGAGTARAYLYRFLDDAKETS
jgi:hypothetical protein